MDEISDRQLRSRLEAYGKKNTDHWSFRGAKRLHAHAYFQYPAMMVPQMVRDLLAAVTSGASAHVYDPFAGSGTALTESMMQGLDFSGQDLNPLAVLLCHAKRIPFFDCSLADAVNRVINKAKVDGSGWVEAEFPNRRKWFTDDVAVDLSRIQRAIRAEESLWIRRFLWVALAETVRLTSNSRTSTFKLHIRAPEDLATRVTNPREIFQEISTRNLELHRSQKKALMERGYLVRGRYKGLINVRIADTSSYAAESKKHHVLITSPPYGDNVTTVPYGQHSYLPLQWIDPHDIDKAIDPKYLATTHEIDRRSLGGSTQCDEESRTALREKSQTLANTLDKLRHEPADRANRVLGFCRDLNRCVKPILKSLRPNAIMVWVLGNRIVGGRPMPLDCILADLLVSEKARVILKLQRQIPSKRMAVRNNIANTMRAETILILRKEKP